jgi:hypothetical protein
VSVGFEGAPGHQAGTVNRDGTPKPNGERGGYGNHPTMGGSDQMTARLGGLWDSLLGEGRRWWITSTSDSHVHYTDGSSDFWPGEYSKTYVHATADYADILDGLRNGRIFVTTGDLIDRLDLSVSRAGRGDGGPNQATVGESLLLRGRDDRGVDVEVRIRVPKKANAHGDRPAPRRIDIIGGSITGPVATPTVDTKPTTKVLARFDESNRRRDGDWITVTHAIDVPGAMYVRVRGTSSHRARAGARRSRHRPVGRSVVLLQPGLHPPLTTVPAYGSLIHTPGRGMRARKTRPRSSGCNAPALGRTRRAWGC